MHGFGLVCFKNGDRYEGIVRNNKMQGKGTYFHRNGDRYEGKV